MMPRLILATEVAPEDAYNRTDLRLWHLLGQGNAQVVCLARKELDDTGGPIKRRLDWSGITMLGGGWQTEDDMERLVDAVLGDLPPETELLVARKDLARRFTRRQPGRCLVDLGESMALYHWRRARQLFPTDRTRALMNVLYAGRDLAREWAIARRAKRTIYGSVADTRPLRWALPADALAIIGNGTSWLGREPPPAEACFPNRIVYHANFAWYPNVAALELILDEVWPWLRREVAEAEFHVVGIGIPDPLYARCIDMGVVVRGFMPDAFTAVSAAGIYLAPMNAGSGVRNKLLDAMAAGVPIATNRIGAEALPEEVRALAIVADEPRELVRRIAGLMRDRSRWTALRAEVRAAAERSFAWPPREAELARLIAEVRPGSPQVAPSLAKPAQP